MKPYLASKSPYNTLIWSVAKKDTNEHGKHKRRMGIEVQKLKDRTITDIYPTPVVAITIQNLGNNIRPSKKNSIIFQINGNFSSLYRAW